MKKLSGLLIATLLFISAVAVNAQAKLKIGHINSQELLQSMPESDSAQASLEKIAREHELVLEEMTVEFNKKFDIYKKAMAATPAMSDLTRTTKEAELEDLQNRIQAFQEQAQSDLQQKRVEIFKPVQDKALKAVNDVAAENGFTYILDAGSGVVVYSGTDAQDIMPLVKAKLGLK